MVHRVFFKKGDFPLPFSLLPSLASRVYFFLPPLSLSWREMTVLLVTL